MICGELFFATSILLALMQHSGSPQVILLAEPQLVELTIRTWRLPWEIVRKENGFTVVKAKNLAH